MSRKALIIDDSKTAYLVLSRMLKPYGLEATHARSGDIGIELLSTEIFDVIFLDQMMPDKTGTETIQEIKQNLEWSKIPIMMFTARTGLDYEKEVRSLGAVGVLPKELNTEEIEKALTKIELWDPNSDDRFEVKLDRRQPTSDEKLRVWLESFLENQFSPQLSKKVKSATDDLRRDTIHYSKRMLNELAKTDKQQAMLQEVKGQTDYLKQLFQNSFKQFRLISGLLTLALLFLAGFFTWFIFNNDQNKQEPQVVKLLQELRQENQELKLLVSENQLINDNYIEPDLTEEFTDTNQTYSLVGIDPSGKYLAAKSNLNYLFMVTDEGQLNNQNIIMYYLDSNCSSQSFADIASGMVVRYEDNLYYSGFNNTAQLVMPLSMRVASQACQSYQGNAKALQEMEINNIGITGVADIDYQLR